MTAVHRHEGRPGKTLGLELTQVLEALRAGKRVRRKLEPWGRLYVDRPVPFLCVYRRAPDATNLEGEKLVTTQASYLLLPGDASAAREVAELVRALVGVLADDFGACLLIEVSISQDRRGAEDVDEPLFRIVTPRSGEPAATVAELETALSRVETAEYRAWVEIERRARTSPKGLNPILGRGDPPGRCFLLGLEIQPVYADPEGELRFPLVHRRLRKDLSGALKRAAFEFTTGHTEQRPSHYHALGRGRFLNAVWEADERLAGVSNRFDFLLLSSPRNAEAAWAEFRRGRFDRPPSFSYPPLPFEPALAKRELYAIPIDRIEDPALEELFREQQDELDRKITMLGDRDTPRFKYGSLQLFGAVDDELLQQAHTLLDRIPPRSREETRGPSLDARAFASRVEGELDYLRGASDALPARVRIRNDLSSVMVSRGHVLVPSHLSVPASRVEALLQHEVGTHIVTYYNGAAQPFRQLRSGLPGYEELQEGLAVLAEYLVGGLSRPRLRILAARVLAVRRMTDGASFVEVFRELDRDYDFAQRTAFTVTMRVFRGGGQAKDAVYLRGLAMLLAYLGSGGDFEQLLLGKIGLQHLEVLRDLQWRKILVPPRFRPRYLELAESKARLEELGAGVQVIDLAQTERRRE
jgi:uncharacterized protein (TIGR02421 family)